MICHSVQWYLLRPLGRNRHARPKPRWESERYSCRLRVYDLQCQHPDAVFTSAQPMSEALTVDTLRKASDMACATTTCTFTAKRTGTGKQAHHSQTNLACTSTAKHKAFVQQPCEPNIPTRGNTKATTSATCRGLAVHNEVSQVTKHSPRFSGANEVNKLKKDAARVASVRTHLRQRH